MSLVLGGFFVQMVLARAVHALWWAPDLLTAALVVSVTRQPARWALASMTAGLCAIIWAVRAPSMIALSYLALGWGMRMALRRWDVSDRRLQGVLAAVACALLTGLAVWADDLWSMPVAGWWLARAAATGAVVRWFPWPRG